jgi:hypothetical protein
MRRGSCFYPEMLAFLRGVKCSEAKLCVAALLLLFAVAPGPAVAGPLLEKARDYDVWYQSYHNPGYGGAVEVTFDSPSGTTVVDYGGEGDSTIWTGTYLASQAFRYAVTGEAEAKANAIRAARALHIHLDATRYTRPDEVAPRRAGAAFIARYVGPAVPPYLHDIPGCKPEEDCHLIDKGPYAGSFWRGNTSRDQYTGWWFGYALAHELVDDEPTRKMIKKDAVAVIEQLRKDRYVIIDVDGVKTTAGPEVGATMQLDWHRIVAEVTGDPLYKWMYEWYAMRKMPTVSLTTFMDLNKYMQYYAFNLAHQTFYNLIRLEDNASRKATLNQIFADKVRRLVAGTHNVFFDFIHMVVSGVTDPSVLADDIEALTLFQDPPNRDIHIDIPEWPLDPTSVSLYQGNLFLHQLIPAIPMFFRPQTLDPHPIDQRCRTDFLWQRSPYEVSCGGGDGRTVNPGIDYLVAYWMGRYHGFLGPDQ